MARLTAQSRKSVPKSQMGNPSKATKKGGAVPGSYPLTDKAHCRAAAGLAGMHNAPASVKARIRKKCGFKK